jgi:ankyrin repeat protein
MGDLAPSKKQSTETNIHLVLEGTPRNGFYGTAIDLRFEALGVQTRDGSYPLHMAVSNHAPLKVLDMLINAAPDAVRLPNKFGEAPLHLALRGSSLFATDEAAMELLLQSDEMGVVLEMPERRSGNLPLHLAVQSESGLPIIVQLLTRFQHAVHVPNNEGKLPMDMAKDASEDLLDLLILVSDEADYQEGVDFDDSEVESEASDLDPLW